MDDAAPVPALSDSYGNVAVAMHWLLAVGIVCTFLIGLTMVDLPLSPQRLRLYNWHKWLGICVLALSAARLVWRAAGHPPPPLPAHTPQWQQQAYRATHLVFYALFFLVPLLGWATTSALGVPVVLFGVLPLPDFVPRDKPLGEDVLAPLHEVASYLLAAI
nr:cytochrome b/b6 domain-containing protein [Caldimonas sp.]